VITLAGGYHSGFNTGFNIAEAVNFALRSWIETGKKADSCKCRGDSVKINMNEFITNINIKFKRKSHTSSEDSSESTNRSIVGNKKIPIPKNFLKCTDFKKSRKIPKSILFNKLKRIWQ
jgi:hypothetical protein